jgi:hypothetical protein
LTSFRENNIRIAGQSALGLFGGFDPRCNFVFQV